MFNHSSKFSFEFIALILSAILCLNIFLVHDEWFRLFNNFFLPSIDGIKSNQSSCGAGQPLSKRQQQYGGLYFNAMVDLDELFTVDVQSINQINEQVIRPELARIQQIQQILNDYAQGIAQYSKASLNPLNSYLLVKKLIRQWEEIQSLYGDADNNLAKFMAEKFTLGRQTNLVKYPDYEDLMAAAVAILRFQETYEISTTELISEYGGVENLIADSDKVMKAQGNLLALGAEECFEIGLLAYRLEHHFYTAEWMQAALNRLPSGFETSLDLELKILEILAYAISQQRNFHRALGVAEKLVKSAPSNHSSAEQWQKNLELYRKAATESNKNANKSGAKNLEQIQKKPQNDEEKLRDERWEHYKQLCRGQFRSQSDKNASILKCYLKQDKSFLKLAPLKVEIIHLEPLLAIFRGVISDKETEIIKELAAPQLSRATVLNMKGQSVYASYRITKTMWLGDEDHPVARRLNKRIEDMTNLDVETAFKLKVFKYGIGGHYDPHYDLALLNDQGKDPLDMDAKLGDRVATCLFYLSQPEKGGLTIFTELGLGIAPSVNDAVFWYNLHRDGQGDFRTKHAACPVLKGDKWIFTKLINERGQEWKRPCPKKREEKGEEFVGDLAGAT